MLSISYAFYFKIALFALWENSFSNLFLYPWIDSITLLADTEKSRLLSLIDPSIL